MKNMQEKRNPQPTQNLQKMTIEPREDDMCINIVTRSGIERGDDVDEGKRMMEDIWLGRLQKDPLVLV